MRPVSNCPRRWPAEDRKVLEARINQLQADIEAGRWERQKDAEDAASREGRLKQEIQKLRQAGRS